MKKILVAVDGSEYSNAAVKKAGELAEKFGSKVTLLNVMKPLSVFHEEIEVVENLQKDEARSILRKSKDILLDMGIDSKTLSKKGDPANEIVDLAKENDVDLVVVGSRGLSGIKMFLLGTVSNRVSEHALCSVLVVREKGS
ncbi:MAG: universal stress protein [Candidatus Hydrothermarchaeales archaeon]